MSSPDFLVLKVNEEKNIVNSYYMDAKWRQFTDEKEALSALKQGGELFKHAQKYKDNWDDVYLFLIAHFTKTQKVDAYLLSVKEITEGKIVLSSLDDETKVFPWIDALHVKEFITWINRIWL